MRKAICYALLALLTVLAFAIFIDDASAGQYFTLANHALGFLFLSWFLMRVARRKSPDAQVAPATPPFEM